MLPEKWQQRHRNETPRRVGASVRASLQIGHLGSRHAVIGPSTVPGER